MANTVYDEMAMDNDWYKRNRNRHDFVRKHLAVNGMLYVQEARKILATLLTDPDLPLSEKDKIHEALVQDAALRGNHDEKLVLPSLN